MDKNLQRFREVFFEEAREHLEAMESGLLGLEAGGAADAESLNRIFRSAHTIKGGSGMFGLEETARFTHSLENLLDQVREGKVAAAPPLVSVLLRACDVVRGLLQAAQQGGADPEMETVLADIQAAAIEGASGGGRSEGAGGAGSHEGASAGSHEGASAGGAAPEVDAAPPGPAPSGGAAVDIRAPDTSSQATGLPRWRIRIQPAPDILRRGLNPLLALRELAELGRISELRMDTSAVPPLAEIDAETCYLAWTLQLDSDQPEERIREVFEFLHEGEGLDLARVTEEMTDEMTGVREETQFRPAPAHPALAHPAPAQPAPAGTGQAREDADRRDAKQAPGKQAHMNHPNFTQPVPAQPDLAHADLSKPPAQPDLSQPPAQPASAQPNLAHPNLAQPAAAATSESVSTIRVDIELLDRLMNQVGELVLARNQILQFAGTTDDASLAGASQRLNLITSELQEGVMKTRMQPIGVAWSMMPRLVRDLAHSCGKQIQLDMEGADTELDRTIMESIKDPLTHLVRNSCDHGLETPRQREARGKPATGKLLLGAYHQGGHVIIEITDDGAGVDLARVKSKAVERGLITADQAARMSEREAMQLIFRPGFSTAERISGISGRGVGMDVAKTNIERVGGTIDVSSRAGEGTTVHIKIPLTLAIIAGMVVEGGGERFVIPQVSLVELVRLEEEQSRERISRIHDAPVCRLRGKLLPLVYLNEILGLAETPAAGAARRDEAVNLVVLQAEDRQFGLVVDQIRDTQEIVVKPLGKQLKGLSAYSGATVMGDGRVALILDVLGVARLAGLGAKYDTEKRAARTAAAGEAESRASERQALLLFRSPGFERMAVPLSLVSRLEEFPGARVEQSGGRPVVQYRDRILPLVSLESPTGAAGSASPMARDPLQVIVFMDGGRGLGLVVGEILDIVDESVEVRKQVSQRGLLGSAVVGGQVTDFLDLSAVVEASGEKWLASGARERTATVLVADGSGFARALLRSSLEMAGHTVVEAASEAEALAGTARHRIDVVALSADLEQAGGGGSLIALIRKQAGREVPMLALGAAADHEHLAACIESALACA